MNVSKKESVTNSTSLTFANKAKTLNPNAAEFVPSPLRLPPAQSGSTLNALDASSRFPSVAVVNRSLDRSSSSVSNASDDEALQYWHCQLPDDITPDFKVMNEDESQGLGGLSLSNLSLQDGCELSRFPLPSGGGYVLTEKQEQSAHHFNGLSLNDKMRYAAASPRKDLSSGNCLNLPVKAWDKQILNSEQTLGNRSNVHYYNENHGHHFMGEMVSKPASLEDFDMNPLEYLALQFPGFAAESLAEIYFASGCDLNLTTEMLTQLELQVDGGFEQNMNLKTLSASNLSALDFPALTPGDCCNGSSNYSGDDTRQSGNPYPSSDKDNMLLFKSSVSFSSKDAVDFASAVRRLPSQDSGVWKYERNSADSTVDSSRSSHVLASPFNSGQGRGDYADRLQNRSSAWAAPAWLETVEAVANMYSELREEARDHARLRNAYFEQARQAYLIGDKALAKELSAKGQLHNMHMKAAHGKAQESIYRQRNPISPMMQGNGRGQERMIDLHGLHVSEAIHVLKHELSALRSTAWAAEQRLQVYICVGTGHHTRSSRTPARLPIAVQRYLLEEEGLDYSETQPGLLRVVVY